MLLAVSAALAGTHGWRDDAIDPSVDPCDDFYRFACGGPGGTEAGLVGAERRTEALLAGWLARDPGTSGGLFRECTDLAAIDAAGLAPLRPWLDAIDAIEDADDALRVSGRLARLGVPGWLHLEAVGGLRGVRVSRPAGPTPLDDPRLVAVLLAAAGRTGPDQAAVAGHARRLREVRSVGDQHELRASPIVLPFLEGLGLEPAGLTWALADPFAETGELLRDTPAPVLRDVLRVRLIASAAPDLSAEVRDPVLAWAGTPSGDRASWCARRVSTVAPGAVDDLFRAHLRAAAPTAALEGVLTSIRRAYLEAIDEDPEGATSGWTTDPRAVSFRLAGGGAPGRPPTGAWWTTWAAARAAWPAGEEPRPVVVANAAFRMDPPEVVLYPGLLATVDPRAPLPAALGGVGAIVGHELTHGYLAPRLGLLGAFAGRPIEVPGAVHVDPPVVSEEARWPLRGACLPGDLTSQQGKHAIAVLHESASDLGGLDLAWRAWRAEGGDLADRRVGRPWTADQVFFLAYGQILCGDLGGGTDDPHPSGDLRVNLALRGFPAFAEVWGCGADRRMAPQACGPW